MEGQTEKEIQENGLCSKPREVNKNGKNDERTETANTSQGGKRRGL